jgi:hypothetical protein
MVATSLRVEIRPASVDGFATASTGAERLLNVSTSFGKPAVLAVMTRYQRWFQNRFRLTGLSL